MPNKPLFHLAGSPSCAAASLSVKHGRTRAPAWGILLLLGFCFLGALSARADDFQKAGALYESGKFSESKKAYEQLVASGPWSANLFYNLGTAEFRLGQLGKAALQFERALLLEHSHGEAAQNLAYVRKQVGAPIPTVPVAHFILVFLGGPGVTAVATVCGWLLIFCATRLLAGGREGRLWWGALLGLLLGGCAAAGLWSLHRDADLAVITQPQVDARAQPADRSPLAAQLSVATRVRVLSELGEWSQCELPNQSRGWIPANALEKIRIAHP